jgi:cell division protein FtsB
MKAKKPASVRGGAEPRRKARNTTRRKADAPPRGRKPMREQRPQRSAPATNPIPRPTDVPARPKNASQAKARAKARKAKAPKVVRPPLRDRIIVRLASIELNPRTLVARVPFVVLVIGSLGVGLGVTLWLSTDAAERSYQLSHARETNQALLQQKEALERQVLEAQAAPALAEAARNLGMIPSRDTAHLVQDASGNWVVVGTPKPAQGVAPAPLNVPLPDEAPPAPPPPPAPRVVDPRELTVHMPPRVPVPGASLPGVERSAPVPGAAPLATPPGVEVPHAVSGQAPTLGPAVAPVPPADAPAAPVAPPAVPADAGAVPLDAGPPPAVAPAAVPVPGAPA